jgi:hypothetical protein
MISDDGSDGDDPRRPTGHKRAESPPPRRRRRNSSDDERQDGQAKAGDARNVPRRPSRSRSPASEINKFRHFLLGTPFVIKCLSDHHSLQFLKKGK